MYDSDESTTQDNNSYHAMVSFINNILHYNFLLCNSEYKYEPTISIEIECLPAKVDSHTMVATLKIWYIIDIA